MYSETPNIKTVYEEIIGESKLLTLELDTTGDLAPEQTDCIKCWTILEAINCEE